MYFLEYPAPLNKQCTPFKKSLCEFIEVVKHACHVHNTQHLEHDVLHLFPLLCKVSYPATQESSALKLQVCYCPIIKMLHPQLSHEIICHLDKNVLTATLLHYFHHHQLSKHSQNCCPSVILCGIKLVRYVTHLKALFNQCA